MDANKGVVLVVAAHPDDEVLGCGGTLLRHHKNGDKTHIVIMTDGAGGIRGYEPDRKPRHATEFRAEYEAMSAAPAWKNAHKAAEMLGVTTLQIHGLRDSYFDTVPILEMAHLVEAAIDRIRPSIVYTHYPGDLSCDHARTAEAVITACRPKSGHPVKQLHFWENPSSTEWQLPLTFQPHMYVKIDVVNKWKVLNTAYGSETREWPHPRSCPAITALSEMRGAQSGLGNAEAFMVGRIAT